jgi:glutaredoxin
MSFVIYVPSNFVCSWSEKAKQLIQVKGFSTTVIPTDTLKTLSFNKQSFDTPVQKKYRTFPQVYFYDKKTLYYVGGYNALEQLFAS